MADASAKAESLTTSGMMLYAADTKKEEKADKPLPAKVSMQRNVNPGGLFPANCLVEVGDLSVVNSSIK